MAKPAEIVADLAVGKAMVVDRWMEVAVPVLIHVTEGVVWQSEQVFPLWDSELETAARVLVRLQEVAVLYWPEFGGAVDWWKWRFPDSS